MKYLIILLFFSEISFICYSNEKTIDSLLEKKKNVFSQDDLDNLSKYIRSVLIKVPSQGITNFSNDFKRIFRIKEKINKSKGMKEQFLYLAIHEAIDKIIAHELLRKDLQRKGAKLAIKFNEKTYNEKILFSLAKKNHTDFNSLIKHLLKRESDFSLYAREKNMNLSNFKNRSFFRLMSKELKDKYQSINFHYNGQEEKQSNKENELFKKTLLIVVRSLDLQTIMSVYKYKNGFAKYQELKKDIKKILKENPRKFIFSKNPTPDNILSTFERYSGNNRKDFLKLSLDLLFYEFISDLESPLSTDQVTDIKE